METQDLYYINLVDRNDGSRYSAGMKLLIVSAFLLSQSAFAVSYTCTDIKDSTHQFKLDLSSESAVLTYVGSDGKDYPVKLNSKPYTPKDADRRAFGLYVPAPGESAGGYYKYLIRQSLFTGEVTKTKDADVIEQDFNEAFEETFLKCVKN